jgi:CBS domain-containing protein
MDQSPTARDYMSTDLVVLSPEMSVHRAMSVLLANDISGAPVVDEHGNLVGVLSERDCLKVVFNASYHQDVGGTVAEYMSRDVQTIEAGTDIVEVVEVFLRSPYRRFPVTAGNQLVGQISRRDILRAVEKLW